MNIRDSFEKLISLPISIYASFKLCENWCDAIRLPVFIRYNTVIKSLRGCVKLENDARNKPFVFKIGFGNIGVFDRRYQRTVIKIEGCIKISGKVYLGHGAKLSVGNNAVLSLGGDLLIPQKGPLSVMRISRLGMIV